MLGSSTSFGSQVREGSVRDRGVRLQQEESTSPRMVLSSFIHEIEVCCRDWVVCRYQIFLERLLSGIQPFKVFNPGMPLLPGIGFFVVIAWSSITWHLRSRDYRLYSPDFLESPSKSQARYYWLFWNIGYFGEIRRLAEERGLCAWDEDRADAVF